MSIEAMRELKALASVQTTPNFTQLMQILDGLNHCHSRDSKVEFLRSWIRDWTQHKVDKLTHPAPSVPATPEPVAWLHVCRKKPELRELSFSKAWPNLAALGYKARPLVLGDTHPAPSVLDGLQWFAVAEHGLPEVGEVVVGGLWYTDPWLKPECATSFMWGQCRVVDTKHRDFKDGKQWLTFGPSHNQITHWARLNPPAMLAAKERS